MSVWLVLPSARPLDVIQPIMVKWLEQGYKLYLMRDSPADEEHMWTELQWMKQMGITAKWTKQYPGYSQAVNFLCARVLAADPQADWLVAAGDDTEPDPNKRADEIGAECADHFRSFFLSHVNYDIAERLGMAQPSKAATFGVMQPTGDDWSDVHEGKKSRIIERIAGSPWMGREFCRRMNGGAGPLWPEYTHCFEDEELQNVAQKLGVFWQRPELTHLHHHWMRRRPETVTIEDPRTPYFPRKVTRDPEPPAHLTEATSKAHWDKYKALFEARKAAGFPGHEPIP